MAFYLNPVYENLSVYRITTIYLKLPHQMHISFTAAEDLYRTN
jgi:hypothetical protein